MAIYEAPGQSPARILKAHVTQKTQGRQFPGSIAHRPCRAEERMKENLKLDDSTGEFRLHPGSPVRNSPKPQAKERQNGGTVPVPAKWRQLPTIPSTTMAFPSTRCHQIHLLVFSGCLLVQTAVSDSVCPYTVNSITIYITPSHGRCCQVPSGGFSALIATKCAKKLSPISKGVKTSQQSRGNSQESRRKSQDYHKTQNGS